jgi:membrane-associated phospholipid phosphatase
MEPILQWGLESIRLIQGFASPALDFVMRIITETGSAAAYLILLPLIYWCIDEKKGMRLGTVVLVSAWVNVSLKLLLNQPRPFFAAYDPSVGMISERLGGLPSGHAQNSLVLWIIIASWGKKKRYFAAAVLFCLLIGFSRVYLGVHFPTDVAGGWILGGLILTVYFLLGKRIETLLMRGGIRAGMIAAAAASFVMILYRPVPEALMPGAMFLGMAAGYALNKRYIGFTGAGVLNRTGADKFLTLAVRFLLGITVTALILLVLRKYILIYKLSGYYMLLYFLGYAAAGIWVYAGSPLLFCVLHLAERRREN